MLGAGGRPRTVGCQYGADTVNARGADRQSHEHECSSRSRGLAPVAVRHTRGTQAPLDRRASGSRRPHRAGLRYAGSHFQVPCACHASSTLFSSRQRSVSLSHIGGNDVRPYALSDLVAMPTQIASMSLKSAGRTGLATVPLPRSPHATAGVPASCARSGGAARVRSSTAKTHARVLGQMSPRGRLLTLTRLFRSGEILHAPVPVRLTRELYTFGFTSAWNCALPRSGAHVGSMRSHAGVRYHGSATSADNTSTALSRRPDSM